MTENKLPQTVQSPEKFGGPLDSVSSGFVNERVFLMTSIMKRRTDSLGGNSKIHNLRRTHRGNGVLNRHYPTPNGSG